MQKGPVALFLTIDGDAMCIRHKEIYFSNFQLPEVLNTYQIKYVARLQNSATLFDM